MTKTIRWITRLLLFATALFFIIGGPLPAWMERIVPVSEKAISPARSTEPAKPFLFIQPNLNVNLKEHHDYRLD